MGLNRIMHYPRKVISMKAKRNIILLIKRQESLYALGLFKTTQHSSGLFFFLMEIVRLGAAPLIPQLVCFREVILLFCDY